MSSPRKRIFIVGCPRSGTSPFAGWLQACGLSTASDPRRREGYPAGFLEHMPILMFHKGLERLSRGSEYAIRCEPYLHSGLLSDPFIEGSFRLAFQPIRDGEIDFIKYPQLSLSIDFLFEQFQDVHVIALWRDPAASFRSMVRREFTWEMILGAGARSVLLWSLHAHHIIAAKRSHPQDVTVVSIEGFLRDPRVGRNLLARIGRSPETAVPVTDVVDLSPWNRRVGTPWRVYHEAMRWVCRRLRRRLGPERAALVDQAAWERALRDVTDVPQTSD